MRRILSWRPLALCLAAALAVPAAQSAPFTPASDDQVVETLPLATNAAAKRVEGLRRQLAARPGDEPLRVEVARRYFELAMAQGDPRLVGYAAAAIAPLAATGRDDAAYWLVRGQLEQYGHQFGPALDSLAKAARLAPTLPDPPAWRAAIFMVQARYAEAASECERLKPIAQPLFATGCSAYVQASTGDLGGAYARLDAAVAGQPQAGPELLVWQHTRLAEMAQRIGDAPAAERHYRAALSQGVTDQFLLGSYADFLIDAKHPGEVLQLLAGWERSDVLLLRLALAGKATAARQAADWAGQLRERFAAAAQRGDRLHEQEAARFLLDIEAQPEAALKMAGSNYEVQKEPRDAWILMRAAIAARQPQAARPALDWLAASRYQDPVLQALATQLGVGR